jgi:hypothetical protein
MPATDGDWLADIEQRMRTVKEACTCENRMYIGLSRLHTDRDGVGLYVNVKIMLVKSSDCLR